LCNSRFVFFSFVEKSDQKSDDKENSNRSKEEHQQDASSTLAIATAKVDVSENQEKQTDACDGKENSRDKAIQELFQNC
jgi:hypothetical protein